MVDNDNQWLIYCLVVWNHGISNDFPETVGNVNWFIFFSGVGIPPTSSIIKHKVKFLDKLRICSSDMLSAPGRWSNLISQTHTCRVRNVQRLRGTNLSRFDEGLLRQWVNRYCTSSTCTNLTMTSLDALPTPSWVLRLKSHCWRFLGEGLVSIRGKGWWADQPVASYIGGVPLLTHSC